MRARCGACWLSRLVSAGGVFLFSSFFAPIPFCWASPALEFTSRGCSAFLFHLKGRFVSQPGSLLPCPACFLPRSV